ncbi:calcium-binding protein [Nocardiopsis sp. RV163]|uniref:calcium-binding protein n=1 Tax=Nocardiopsis sp. RV163 TaxID=1661388 RepID=UPI000A8E6312|nr:calcium-binding protein [Nocardiopsis sp. RV163]
MGEHVEHGQEDAAVDPSPRGRGGSMAAIRAALARPAARGPAHWTGQLPERRQEPVDVIGRSTPGSLPPTR